METYVLNEAGEPVREPDIVRWGTWFEQAANRLVGKATVGAVEVSTVFLGIDHGYSGRPVLWETMVFGDGPLADYQWRYATRAEAEVGHGIVCDVLSALLNVEPTVETPLPIGGPRAMFVRPDENSGLTTEREAPIIGPTKNETPD